MIIEVPDWCRIGAYIEWKAPQYTGYEWVREKIIAYGYDGFFHQAHNCPMYFTKFSEFGKTVRLEKIQNNDFKRGNQMDITKIAYEKYKLDWMIQHGFTLNDLVTELEKMREEDEDASLESLFEDWEFGYGFDSEIWACYDEFMDIEFYDSEYMASLLTSNEYTTYVAYVVEHPFNGDEDEEDDE